MTQEKKRLRLQKMLQEAANYAQQNDLQLISFCMRPDSDEDIYACHYSSLDFELASLHALKTEVFSSISERMTPNAEA